VLGVAGASDRNGLGLDLGVVANALARVAFNGARMGRDPGGVVDDAQSGRVGLVRADVVGADSAAVRASMGWLCVVCGVALDGCGKRSSYS
jgi:hypothetical protein